MNVHEAKTQLSKLLAKVEFGEEEVIIARDGKPIAKLVYYRAPGPRRFGTGGPIWIAPDFDDPVDPETWGLENMPLDEPKEPK